MLPTIKEARIKDREMSVSLEPTRELMTLWVETARAWLQGGPNYSETICERVDQGLEDPESHAQITVESGPERYLLRVQRVGKVTPHEARLEAEASLAKAEAQLAMWRDAWAGVRNRLEAEDFGWQDFEVLETLYEQGVPS